ncbi:DUF6286 domain-containing protein [Nocardioides nanhaiensis]|uniref:DUF6286 domain-containing protein n=1 Tax=Nocardioides nanhaiensis TaxID=1476871 RepID=A0ABP8VUL9_9ACTN
MSDPTVAARPASPPRTPPRARPAAVTTSAVLALVLIALGVVSVHDLAASQGWSSGSSWTRSVLDSVEGLTASVLVVAVAVVLVLLGLVVLLTAFRPGRRTHLPTQGDADLWVSAGALAALAGASADRAPGVISAEATRIRPRSITVDVVTHQDPGTVEAAARAAVDTSPGDLAKTRIDIRIKEVPR